MDLEVRSAGPTFSVWSTVPPCCQLGNTIEPQAISSLCGCETCLPLPAFTLLALMLQFYTISSTTTLTRWMGRGEGGVGGTVIIKRQILRLWGSGSQSQHQGPQEVIPTFTPELPDLRNSRALGAWASRLLLGTVPVQLPLLHQRILQCLKEVCAHQEVLRADPCQDIFPKCGAMSRAACFNLWPPSAPGAARASRISAPNFCAFSLLS